MSETVEFFFDFGSSTTYLAWTQLPALAGRCGATIRWRPMLLGGVFKATGNASPINVPAKGRWMLRDIQRYARLYDVPFVMNPNFPINTLPLMRGAASYQMNGDFDGYVAAMFRAIWVEALNVGDEAVLRGVLERAGLHAADFAARIQRPEVKQALIENTEEAVRRGVFGAPTFFVGEEMFFGQDRLPMVEEWLGEGRS
jgi:2-hydroxychromene-2-carboxylate isomerase